MTATVGSAAAHVVLSVREVSRSFPGVRALEDVDLELLSGEVHALLGENGAGKSTLIKILNGALAPEAGRLELEGSSYVPQDPADASGHGVVTVHQEFALIPTLSITANLFLGRSRGWIERHREEREAAAALGRVGLQLDPKTLVADLSVGQQQLVEIAKALSREARVLILDEPTAALSPTESGRLLAIVRELAEAGLAVLFVTHRLEEVEEVADRVTVLRDGQVVSSALRASSSRADWIEAMVGRSLDHEYPPRVDHGAETRLELSGLTRWRRVEDVTFVARRGEVLGITGLVGSGRTELLRLLFGADRADSGRIVLDGRELSLRSPRDAMRAGIGMLTEDRKQQGLLLQRSLRENFALGHAGLARRGWLRPSHERSRLEARAATVGLDASRAESAAGALSGGNQQKLLFARWLEREPEVLLLDEPTRGVDVGAKFEVHALMRELAASGKTVIFVSSELPEVLGVADRVVLMHEGRLRATVENDDSLTQQALLGAALGVSK